MQPEDAQHRRDAAEGWCEMPVNDVNHQPAAVGRAFLVPLTANPRVQKLSDVTPEN